MFFSQPDFWIRYFNFLKWFFIIFDIILIAVIVYSIYKFWHYRPNLHPDNEPKKRTINLSEKIMQERWERVVKKFMLGTHEAITLSVIEADKVVDDTLKQMGFEGEHMSDRLGQLSSDEVKSLEGVWRAHRLRNNLVHSPDFKVGPDEAERALDAFEAFLKELKAL